MDDIEKAEQAFDRLHQAATTTAPENPINVLAGDVLALLNVIGPPPSKRAKPQEPEPPPPAK